MDDETNVVLFPDVHSIEAPPIVIPLDSVEHARAAVDQCMAALELMQTMLAQVPKHGDAMALHGASRVLGALSRVLDNLRTGRQIDPAHAAAVIARVTQQVRERAGEDAARAVAGQLTAGLACLLDRAGPAA